MKKNVIALAVAAAMAAPLAAQAEVTVSGQLQAEVTSMSGDTVAEGLYVNDAQEMGVTEKGNFGALNISASEDLGGGMKAIAKIGMNIHAADHTAKGIGPRDAYVGLSGNFGTVMAGTMSTPYKMATVKWDPFLATSAQARGNHGSSTLDNGYAENVIAYANKFGMAKVVLAASVNETDKDAAGDLEGDHTLTASLNVPVGPVELALGYLDDASVDDGTAMKVGVKYSAGAIGVSFVYEDVDAAHQFDWLKAAGLDVILGGLGVTYNNKGETFMKLAGTYTAGANTFALSYGMNDADIEFCALGICADGEASFTHTSLGMVHAFSKNTSAHIAYTSLDHDGIDDSGIAAGLRVKF